MKKTTLIKDAFDYQAYFDENYYHPNQMTNAETLAVEKDSTAKNSAFSAKFLSTIKWIFLYLPGAATIHFIVLSFVLVGSYSDFAGEMLLGTLGAFAFAAFMIMLGIGKLLDLRYLKVVAGIALSSFSMAILYLILAKSFAGDFFGFFLKATFPLAVVTGFLVKLDVDRKSEVDKI